MKHSLIIISLVSLMVSLTLLSTAQCIQGNCQNGYGLFRTGQTYQLSNWKNGKAEGDGMRIVFHMTTSDFSRFNTEADFLLLTAFETPSLEAVLKLKPQIVIKGVFTQGELNGAGELWATDIQTLPELKWLLRFTESWIGGTWSWKQMLYKGAFEQTKPNGYGTITLNMTMATITCTGKGLTNQNNPDVIVEAENPNYKSKRLFRGSFVNGVPHGFSVTNFDKQNPDLTELRRQLWTYGRARLAGKEGQYPADEINTRELKLPDGSLYTGPLNSENKPIGFGRKVKAQSDGSLEWIYTGYFSNGLRSGPGFFEVPRQNGYSLAGEFSVDTFMLGTVYTYTPSSFVQTVVSKFIPGTYIPSTTFGSVGEWANRTAFETGEKAITLYGGGFNHAGHYEGNGTLTTAKGETRSGIWLNGVIAEQTSGEISYSSLYENCIIVLNGIASPVKRNYTTLRWHTLSGQIVPEGGKVRLSKYGYKTFFGSCSMCNGSGKESQTHLVDASTTTFTHKFSTVEGGGAYMDSYWQKTTTTSYSFTRPAYYTFTYKTCSACNGGGTNSTKTGIPEE